MSLLSVIIPNRFIGQRIDAAMAQMLPNYSRVKITYWIKSGDALIHHKTFKPKEKVLGGEVITLSIKIEKTNAWLAQDIVIDVVYEDEAIIIVNKPVNLVTHPGVSNWTGTLANALLHYDSSLANLDRAGIVHRLDKNTSGLMVVARSEYAQKYLTRQLQTHSISREYSAIVYGHMISGGTVDKPIGRDPKDRIRQTVTESGKDALTHYRVIERFAHHTHVKVMLETGRTHQIRVHLSFIGHPLIADPMYGGKIRFPKKADKQLKNSLKNFNRQTLHAKKLTLIHPTSTELMSWKVPLPQDMQDLLQVLAKFDAN
ncbi:ribosomal large subunit pseudouridine synthase D [Candidatus Ruthia magnifica str. Cm (Calyptogena magnifica)]|uniref:Pseudouridine synthase n=1 Tax=Ruthia magnifica subsp. Calyptogena magnifica TaxID=413404 RepID=A1AW00_RUTMC|nr:23S rRNA pseudouridine(1911/1915/1917) synthase RluD [Candidatus Ruthturnera calyptogenae]ABL02107.1 ribosomal large subunit pseudouridine synthase D [Candidatus Ruthia magnifica str. Cm (Calyptogena magnifica)]